MVLPAHVADLPLRPAGTRARSGNAMHRSRAALLEAAAQCVERAGARATTMADVAEQAGLAKATLYNHFRTKDDLLAALVQARVDALADACTEVAAARPLPVTVPGLSSPDVGRGLGASLAVAAAALGASGPLRRLAADEPAVAARLATPGPGRAWDAVRRRVGDVLLAGGGRTDPGSVELVLRWLAAQALAPASAEEVAAAVRVFDAGLRERPALDA